MKLTDKPETVTLPSETNPHLTAHAVTPDRTLMIEKDNPDGWIASTLTVPIRP